MWSEDKVNNTKHFCLMPWVHVHVTQYGTVTPCCQTSWKEEHAFGNVNRQSIEEVWNGEAIRNFRLKMLNDQPDERCYRCYDKEKAGIYSLRKATNKDYSHHLERVKNTTEDGTSKNTQPVYFDIRFSNFCNFKCRICGPWSSSSWFQDARQLGWVSDDIRLSRAIENEDSFFAQFKNYLPHVEEIYFAGGEPMLMEQHYRVLDLLLELGLTKTYLRYNTNFSVFEFKGKSIFEYWKQFENIFLCASLDGQGKHGEWQRSGQVWDQVVLNRKRLMDECPHIDFMLAPTISVLNVFQLPQFHQEWTMQGLIDVSEIFPSLLEEPDYYNIQVLTPPLKHQVEEIYTRHLEWMKSQSSKNEAVKVLVMQEFANCIKYMWQADKSTLLPLLRQTTTQLDELRNETTFDITPELKGLNVEQ